MTNKTSITHVYAREILDSRGNPTIEASVELKDGSIGLAAVPSGASTGAYEAVELRDGDKKHYQGMGVTKAAGHVNRILAERIMGEDALNQQHIDQLLCDADGSDNKGKIGANGILGVSLAVAKAAAAALHIPLYRYLGGIYGNTLPVPMMNILNGGKHADSSMSIQEFMIMPIGASRFSQGLEWSVNVFHTLKKLLKAEGYVTAVGDEGGFAPKLKSDEDGFAYIVRAIEEAGYVPGKDFALAIDVASTEMYEEAKKQGRDGEYLFWKAGEYKSPQEMIQYLEYLCGKYPIVSIEDGLAEEDWDNWVLLQKQLGSKIQLVGDDLFVTNTKRLEKGISMKAAGALLVKPNQIGTLSETMEAVYLVQKTGWAAILSHRSGETEDVTIADMAVGLNAGQIKTGAPSRSDRVAKYNRLLKIEEELGGQAVYLGRKALYSQE